MEHFEGPLKTWIGPFALTTFDVVINDYIDVVIVSRVFSCPSSSIPLYGND